MVELQFFTPAEIAERLKYSERQVREAIHKHRIPTIGRHKSMRLDAHSVAALIEALRQPRQSLSIDATATPRRGNAYERVRARLASPSLTKKPQ